MKKILVTFALVLALFASSQVSHAATICEVIDESNYEMCCNPLVGGEAVGANNKQCSDYEASITAKPATTTQVNSCSTITDANAGTCCTNATTETMQNACQQYYYYNPPASTGQVGATAPTTNPVNTNNTAYNTGSGAGLAATATDLQAAKSCSAIKFKTLLDIAIWAKCLIGAVVIPGIFSLAFVVFLWGVLKFIRSSDQKDKQESKQFIYMGLIGLFVMVSVWGIIKVAATTFGLDTTVPVLQTDYLSTSKASK